MTTKNTEKNAYDAAFYSDYAAESYRSARALLPVVQAIVHPERIIDIGCGIGTWLCCWKDLGAGSVVGVDGSYVTTDSLRIEESEFVPMDLTNPTSIPGTPFDLAQSLEVAEHLPEEAASRFVAFLCSLSPVVLFSAAIPHQGGTSHINEQWPEYWAALFRSHDYCVFDVIRPAVWDNTEIAYYYAQNSFLFVNRKHIASYPRLNELNSASDYGALARVHPRKWQEHAGAVPRFEDLMGVAPRSALLFGKRVLRRLKRLVASSNGT